MSLNSPDAYLNINNANLRVYGNVHTNQVHLGNMTVRPSYGLSTVTDVSNTTPDTIQFTNPTTGLVTTGNVTVGKDLTVGTANLFVDTQTGRVGVGTTNPRASLDINSTGSLIVPIGTTAERPSTPVNGMLRFNTTSNAFECFYQPTWQSIFSFALYDFTSHTFTNAGQTGRTGPTLTQLTSAYTPTWTDDTNFLNVVTTGIQEWTVPVTGTYEIEVAGARGGFGGAVTQTEGSGGKGGWTKGQMSLSQGTVLKLIVGQAGADAGAGSTLAGGGGGASWVLSSGLATLYAVAGGGGGCNAPAYSEPALGGDGGSSQASVSDTAGGAQGSYQSGGGAGFGGNGVGNYSTTQTGGYSPANGAMGGEGNTGHNVIYQQEGGFGGGGGAGAHAGGGGGGYAGGDGVAYNVTPGAYGGTTRNNMNLPTFDTHTGQHGYIKITLL